MDLKGQGIFTHSAQLYQNKLKKGLLSSYFYHISMVHREM